MASTLAISAFDKSMVRMDKKVTKWLKEDYKQMLNSIEEITRRLTKLRPILDDLTGKDWLIYLRMIDQASDPAKGIIKRIKSEIQKARSDLIIGVKLDGDMGFINKVKSQIANVNTQLVQQFTRNSSQSIYNNPGFKQDELRKSTLRPKKFGSNYDNPYKPRKSLFKKPDNTKKESFSDRVSSFEKEYKATDKMFKGVTEAFGVKDYKKKLKLDSTPIMELATSPNAPPAFTNAVQKVSSATANAKFRIMDYATNPSTPQAVTNLTQGMANVAQAATPMLAVAGATKAISTMKGVASDIKVAVNSDNKEESKAYKDAAIIKSLATGAGAVIGTIFGPGAGTMIGAGIGAAIGDFVGGKRIEKFEKEEAERKEQKRQVEIRKEQKKYDNDEMKDAIKKLYEGDISQQEFEKIHQKELTKDLDKRFGTVKVSLAEIQSMAKNIMFSDSVKEMEKFAFASSAAQQSLESMSSSERNLEKLEWKQKNGGLSKEEKTQYAQLGSQYKDEANLYMDNMQYKGAMASEAFFDSEDQTAEMNDNMDKYYGLKNEELQQQYENMKQAIKNNDSIGAAEARKEITNLTTGADDKARKNVQEDVIKNMNYGSARELGSAVNDYVQTALDENYELFNENMMNLEKLRESGIINQVEFENQRAGLYNQLDDRNTEAEQIGKSAYTSQLVNNFQDVLQLSNLEKLKNGDGETQQLYMDRIVNKLENDGVTAETLNMDTMKEVMQISGDISEGMQLQLENFIGILKESLPSENPDGVEGQSGCCGGAGASAGEEGADVIPTEVNITYNPDTEQLAEAAAAYKELVISNIDDALAAGVDAEVTARLKVNYVVQNQVSRLIVGDQGSCTIRANVVPFANGGMVNGPLMSLIGEDGPEAIIPLGSKRRGRGLSLWAQAGEALGVSAFADGGIVGDYSVPDEGGETIPLTSGEDGGKTEVKVDVNVSPKFEISGSESSEENVMEVIKAHMKEMADALGGEIAGKLEAVFSNMPLSQS